MRSITSPGCLSFFEHKKLKTKTFSNANAFANEIRSKTYRCLIVDLNVPVLPPMDKDAEYKGHIYRRYPGLFVAALARDFGYRGRQVLIYSVHKDQEVEVEATRLQCTYIRKGRPRDMKAELEDLLSYDPTKE